MDTLRLGEVTVTRVVEIGRSFFPTASMLPTSSADVIDRHRAWLAPFWDDATGDIGSRIQSWIVRTPRHTVLIDTGIGNDKDRSSWGAATRSPHTPRDESPLWHLRQGTFLDDLAAAGAKSEDVDLVVCTHLHVDHVGWNTRLLDHRGGTAAVPPHPPGRWVPTVPRATYLFVGEAWEFWNHERLEGREPYGCVADSVVPIVDAGRARLVDSKHVVDDWLSFEPWPGHTPGHACVRLRTRAGDAVFAGDVMHRVVQVAEPQWSSRFCNDAAHAAKTRREFVERHADTGTIVLAAHFPLPGRIVRETDGLRFRPVSFTG